MNVSSLPASYDTSVYTHNLFFMDSAIGRYYLIVSTEPLTYQNVKNYHRAIASADCDYRAYYSSDLSTWNDSISGSVSANGTLSFGTKYGEAVDIQNDVEFVLPTPEPTATPEPEATPTPTPEVTTPPDVTTEPEATPEASTSPTLPSNITVVVGDEVIETLRTIQEVNEQNRDLLTTIQESSTESMAVLYSQHEAQQNFNYAVMAMLGLIFGAIFIKGIFYKR